MEEEVAVGFIGMNAMESTAEEQDCVEEDGGTEKSFSKAEAKASSSSVSNAHLEENGPG